MKNIIEEHFNQSSLTINSLKKHKKKILEIVNLIVNCKKKKKKQRKHHSEYMPTKTTKNIKKQK